jgi:hypothetical protein
MASGSRGLRTWSVAMKILDRMAVASLIAVSQIANGCSLSTPKTSSGTTHSLSTESDKHRISIDESGVLQNLAAAELAKRALRKTLCEVWKHNQSATIEVNWVYSVDAGSTDDIVVKFDADGRGLVRVVSKSSHLAVEYTGDNESVFAGENIEQTRTREFDAVMFLDSGTGSETNSILIDCSVAANRGDKLKLRSAVSSDTLVW